MVKFFSADGKNFTILYRLSIYLLLSDRSRKELEVYSLETYLNLYYPIGIDEDK